MSENAGVDCECMCKAREQVKRLLWARASELRLREQRSRDVGDVATAAWYGYQAEIFVRIVDVVETIKV